MSTSFIKYIEKSLKDHWDLKAMTNYVTKDEYDYSQVAREIAKIHVLFKELNITQDDKIALVGRNTPEWAIIFLATVSYGAVIVPILQDFHPNDVQHIINHSESKLVFLSDNQWDNLDETKMPLVRGVFSFTDFRCIYQAAGETIQMTMKHLEKSFEETYPNGFTKDSINFKDKDGNAMTILNYTSGTTGFSKGVMLTGENI
jgi:long-chain acyl-CoA synthetase